MRCDAATASAFARVALANVSRPMPHALHHLLTVDGEPLPSSHVVLHPAFFGSYDWHSAVHMHWLLVRVLRTHGTVPESTAIEAILDERFTPSVIGRELAYFLSPAGRTFERPYGWAWLLELAAELARLTESAPRAASWGMAVEPLARELAARMRSFVEAAVYPIRAGTHGNTAFACLLAHDYAQACDDAPLAAAVESAAMRWFGGDRVAPIDYEPSLTDFLSPILAEASLQARVMPSDRFAEWLTSLLPHGLGPLADPPIVGDRHDPQIAHLDGLSLSRAWMLERMASGLPAGDDRVDRFRAAAARHLAAGLPWTVGGDYVGEHWLASFAALALGVTP